MTLHRLFTVDTILIRVCYHSSIRDIVILSRVCKTLHQRIFNHGQLWKQRNLICQPQDIPWLVSDKQHHRKMIRQLVLQLPRHHGLKTLMIRDLPTLDTMTLFAILDLCAHSVLHLDLTLTNGQCEQLCMHLEAFCFHLATSQIWNKIPLTLHQYTLDSTLLYHDALLNLRSQASSSSSSSSSTSLRQPFFIHHLISHGLPTKMDDPPFEVLERITLNIITSTTDSFMLIQRFHHLMGLLSRHSPTLTSSALSSSSSASSSLPKIGQTSTDNISNSTSTSTITSVVKIPKPVLPPLSPSSSSSSMSSVLSSLRTSSSRSLTIIGKRDSSSSSSVTAEDHRKKKKQQAVEKRKQYYYDRIHHLSHQSQIQQLLASTITKGRKSDNRDDRIGGNQQQRRSISNSPPPSPPTPPPQRHTFISNDNPVIKQQSSGTEFPPVHVMRYRPSRSKK